VCQDPPHDADFAPASTLLRATARTGAAAPVGHGVSGGKSAATNHHPVHKLFDDE
jgi:hypothetical protein